MDPRTPARKIRQGIGGGTGGYRQGPGYSFSRRIFRRIGAAIPRSHDHHHPTPAGKRTIIIVTPTIVIITSYYPYNLSQEIGGAGRPQAQVDDVRSVVRSRIAVRISRIG
jgi:hypothetical protein